MEEKKKKQIDIDSRPVFWTRFVLWVIFSVVIPICFIGYRYDIFKKLNGVSFSGWGILAGVIVFVFVIMFLRSILHSKKYAFYKQVIKGCLYLVFPTFFVMWVLYVSRNTIDQLIQVLGLCTLSWAIAVCVNPMPRYTYITSQGETADMIEMILGKREQKKNK